MASNLMIWVPVGILILLIVSFVLLYNRLQRLRVKVEEAGSDIDVALEKRYDMLSEQLEAVKKYLSHEYKTLTDVTAMRSGVVMEEKRMIQQREISDEVIQSIDREISRQTESMDKIKQKLNQNRMQQGGGSREARERDARRRAEGKKAIEKKDAQRKANVNQKIGALASVHRDLSGVTAGIDALYEQYPVLNSWMSMDYFHRAVYNSEEHLQAARRLYNSNVSLYNQALVTIPWSIVAALLHMERASFYEVEEHKRSFTVNFD